LDQILGSMNQPAVDTTTPTVQVDPTTQPEVTAQPEVQPTVTQ